MPPRQTPQVDFPERVWEPAGSGLWTSRPATTDDLKRRGQLLHDLKAISNSPHIPFEKE